MKATKTFVRAGRRYKPGDTIEGVLDTETVSHYERHGMIAPADTGTVIAGTGARLAPNTPQTLPVRQRAKGTKIAGTPESSLEVRPLLPLSTVTTAGARLPGPAETRVPGPSEQNQRGPNDQGDAGPEETGKPLGPQEPAQTASLPLGSVDSAV
jgi:hypothetical protein